MTSPPDRLQEMIAEVAQEGADRYKETLQKALDSGWHIYDKRPPAERLRYFMLQTAPVDLDMILMEDYTEQARAGLLPLPVSPFWYSLMSLPAFVAERFMSDFRHLLREQRLRIVQMSSPAQAPVGQGGSSEAMA